MIYALVAERPPDERAIGGYATVFTPRVAPLRVRMWPDDADELRNHLQTTPDEPVEVDVGGDRGPWLIVSVGAFFTRSTVTVDLIRWVPRLDGFAEGLRRIGAAMGVRS